MTRPDFPRFATPRSEKQGETVTLSGDVYVTPDALENQIDEQRLAKLNGLAIEHGWRQAIDLDDEARELAGYISSPDRLAVVDFLPLGDGMRILEIGPGYGQMSVALSGKVGTLDCLEVSLGQARFCATRCRQERAGNVRIVAAGRDCILPYADASFDGVVMNLVLEWCGLRSSGQTHEQMQAAYLAEIARVLKPGGFAFISTKNRFALRLLVGGRDEHMSNMRFGSALPRSIGRLLHGKSRQPGYLHSYSKLENMLREAGFRSVSGFWSAPDMRWPKAFVPLNAAAISQARKTPGFISANGKKMRWLMDRLPFPILRRVTPGLTFLCER